MRLGILIPFYIVFSFSLAQAKRTPQSLNPAFDATSEIEYEEETSLRFSKPLNNLPCFNGENLHFATNKKTYIGEKVYPADTYINVYRDEDVLRVMAHEVVETEDGERLVGNYHELPLTGLSCDQVTVIPTIEDPETGEVSLGEYSLPIDYQFAVTYCYREVKRRVRSKIALTGASAYMANAQLKSNGWSRHTSYESAPNGSICVFGPGGKVTKSGGHRHGHIGIKGQGGVINPASGFRLGRPFWGCYTEPGTNVVSQKPRRNTTRSASARQTTRVQEDRAKSCLNARGGKVICPAVPWGARNNHGCGRVNDKTSKYHRHWVCTSNPYK